MANARTPAGTMIDFNCPHCGNHFSVDVALAGRHGWCRVCNGFIVVPTARSRHKWEDLPPEQRVKRLEEILRNTTQLLQAQQARMTEFEHAFQRAEESAARAQAAEARRDEIAARLAEAQRELTRLSTELGRVAEEKGAAFAQLQRLSAEVAQRPAPSGATRDAAQPPPGQTEALEKLTAALEESRRAETARTEEVRQLEHELAAASLEIARWRGEADRRAETEAKLRDIEKKRDEAQSLIAQLQPGIAEARERQGRAESDAAAAQAQAKALDREVQQLRDERDQQREALAVMRAEQGTLMERISRLENDLEEARASEIRAVRAAEESAAEEVRGELEAARVARVDAEARAEDLASRLGEAEAALEANKATCAHLEDAVARLERERTKLDTAEAQHTAAKTELAAVQARLAESQRQVDYLTERLAEEAQTAAVRVLGPSTRTPAVPPIPAKPDREMALIPEIIDEDGDLGSNALMASLLRFIESSSADAPQNK